MGNGRFCSAIFSVVLGIAFAEPGSAQLEGRHVGSFECYQKPRQFVELEIEDKRKGKSFAAKLTLYESADSRKATSTMAFSGKIFSEWKLGLSADKSSAKNLPEPMTPSMSCNVGKGKIYCHTTNHGCSFAVARVGSLEADTILGKLKWAQRYDEVQAMPAERRPGHTKLHGGNQRFEYVDVRLVGKWDNLEVEPVDSVSDWLNQSDMKCLTTNEVSWRGKTGTAVVRHFGKKMNVIDCRGACQGLAYRWSGWNGVVTHYGLSKAVPVVEMRTWSSASLDMTWTFEYEGPGEKPPRILIHQWTKDPGDTGPGCRLFQ